MSGAGVLVSSLTRPVKTDGVSQNVLNGPHTYSSRHKMCGSCDIAVSGVVMCRNLIWQWKDSL